MPNFDVTSVNLNAVSMFQTFQTHARNPDAIANLDGNGKIRQAGTYKGALGSLSRTDAERAQNNAVRTQLLSSLGKAFGLQSGITKGANGRISFSNEFMDKLQHLLGDSFKRSDFGVSADGGEVTSGKPLTHRRISAILAQTEAIHNAKQFTFEAANTQLGEALSCVNTTVSDAGGMQRRLNAMTFVRSTINALQLLKELDGSDKKIVQQDGDEDFVVRAGGRNITFIEKMSELSKAFTAEGFNIKLDNPKASVEEVNQEFHDKLEKFVKKSVEALNYARNNGKMDEFMGGLPNVLTQGVEIGAMGEYAEQFLQAHDA